MKSKQLSLLLATTCAASLAIIPAAAWAQDAGQAASVLNTVPQDAGTKTAGPDQLNADRVSADGSTGKGDVVVTGTRIHNPNLASAAPIQTVTDKEIQLSGAVNIEDVLNRLPQVIPTNPGSEQEGNGTSRVSLRSFGTGGSGGPTLTLIDGLRVTGGGGGDINLIPPSLVERIDVLTGGAAATYGADAIAGVVNFVLKRNFNGLIIDADEGFYDHYNGLNATTATAQRSGIPYQTGHVDDGFRGTINVSAGKRLLDDRLSLSAFFTYRHTDPIALTDRSFNACQMEEPTPGALPACITTRTSYNGVIIPQSGPNSGNLLVNNGDGTRAFHPFASSDNINLNDSTYYALHENWRANAGGFLSFKATDWAEMYGSFLYENNKYINSYDPVTIYAGSYNGNGYTLNCANPLMSAQQAQAICGSLAGQNTTVPIDIRYRFNAYGGQILTDRQYQARGTFGVRGDFASAWHYDIGLVYSSSISYRIVDSNWNADPNRVSNALNVVNYNGTPTCVAKINGTDPNCVPLDVFVADSSSPASYQYIFKGMPDGAARSYDLFGDASGTITGDLGHYGIRSPLAHNGLQLALNTEFRREVTGNETDAEYNTIFAGAPNPGSSSYAAENIFDYGFEASLPLVEDKPFMKVLGVDGGYRRSKYSASTDTFATWKAEGTWAPTQDIRFRYSRNFASAAPSAYYTTIVPQYSQVTNYGDPCAATPIVDPTTGKISGYGNPAFSLQSCRAQRGWNDSYYGSTSIICPDTGCVYRTTGPINVGPTEANSYTIGAIITPRIIPRLSISIDRYTIRFLKQITYFAPLDSYDECKQYGSAPTALNLQGCQNFYRNAAGQLFGSTNSPSTGFTSGQYTYAPYNAVSQGWDFQAHYDFPLTRAGRVALDFNGGLITNSDGGTGTGNVTGYYGPFFGNPLAKWRHNLRGTFTTNNGVFQASLNWRHISGMRNAVNDCPKFNSGLACTDPNVYGASYVPETAFGSIPAYNYFDLAANVNIARRFTWGVTVNNLFDKDPPLLPTIGSGRNYSTNGYQNALVYLYDPYGRYIQMNVRVKF